jgi:hypothetical protein
MSKLVEIDPIRTTEQDVITPPPHYEGADSSDTAQPERGMAVSPDLTDEDIHRLAIEFVREQDEEDRLSGIWLLMIGALSGAMSVILVQVVIGLAYAIIH